MGPEQLDVIHMIANAGLMVQFVMLLLLFFSVTSWGIMLIKYRYFKKAFDESAYFTDFFGKAAICPMPLPRLNSSKGVRWPGFSAWATRN